MNKILKGFSLLLILSISINYKTTRKRSFLEITKAFAATYINPSSLDLNTPSGLANYVRYFYYMVNGDSDEYYTDFHEGYIGNINGLLGPDAMGGELAKFGYATCADIPTTGSNTTNVEGDTVILDYKPGTKTIPSHFGTNGGSTFDKRIVIKWAGTPAFNVEFKCSASSTVTTGYILLGNNPMIPEMTFEMYFQMDSATKATYLDYFTKGIPGDTSPRTALRFSSPDGRNFKLYQVFTFSNGGNAYAINGSTDGPSKINFLFSNDLSSSAATAVVHNVSGVTTGAGAGKQTGCIDLLTNSTDSGCASITDPGSISIGSSSYTFSMSDVSTLNLSTVQAQ